MTTQGFSSDDRVPGSADKVRELVRVSYGKVAKEAGSCCGPDCCWPGDAEAKHDPNVIAQKVGYGAEAIASVPEGANLGLGCGNPLAIAQLNEGEVVVDLGAGAGFDAFLAAEKVGKMGRVIGVDMTPEMLGRARENAVKAGVTETVEFREGLIESLPVTDASADVVISNCVINLSPDKPQVFREAFRVLKPGGRLAVSDIVLTEPLPGPVAELAAGYVACVSGAITAEEYLGAIEAAGFVDVEFTRVPASTLIEGIATDPIARDVANLLSPEQIAKVAASVWSYKIEARKPEPGARA